MVVCESGVCAPADVHLDPGPADVVVDDVPVAPAVTGGGTACIERTFVVADTLAIGEVRVGLTISHTHRDDLAGVLTSPANTQVEIISPDGRDAAANYDVLLSDAAPSALHSGRGDDPGGPAYARLARPSAPLQAFLGEEAAGTWTLSLCGADRGAAEGQYLQGRLILVPQDTGSRTGRWYYPVFDDAAPVGIGEGGYVERSFQVSGVDAVGNRSTALDLTLIIDATGPDITVTEWPDAPVPAAGPVRMAGEVADAGGVSAVRLMGVAPDGSKVGARLPRVGGAWVYTDTVLFTRDGTYTFFIEAQDAAGNVSTLGPLEVEVATSRTPATVYLPVVTQDHLRAPDLIVDEIRADAGTVEVVIRNRGNAPVVDAFWVDLYVNPNPAPTGVNQVWEDLASQGLVWGVEGGALPLMPDDSLTLRVGDAYFWESYSRVRWPLAQGTVLYAQVDSTDADTTYGGVLENHEIQGGFYNNIDVATVGQLNVAHGVVASSQAPDLREGLPSRAKRPVGPR